MAQECTEKTLERNKRCRCTPYCNKWRTARTRRRHYRNAIPQYSLPSESESASSEYEDESQSDHAPDARDPSEALLTTIMSMDPHFPVQDLDAADALSKSQHSQSMDIDVEEPAEYSASGIPGYFNCLTPEEDEEFEIKVWSGFDETEDP